MQPDSYHTSVMLPEVLEQLHIQEGDSYIDATLGGGGHTLGIVERGGHVLAIDVDEDALAYVESQKSNVPNAKNLILVQGNFRDIDRIAKEHGYEKVAGILFDLGVSSHQLDTSGRGFSIRHNGPLDMRMDKTLSVRASDLVNGLTKQELTDLFIRFGEEGFARQIAGQIVEARKSKPIQTTGELAELVENVVRGNKLQIHPATKVFQALRIIVNDELNSLSEALPKAVLLLKKNGRLAVITFHSLEDRIVKHLFDEFSQEGKGRVLTEKPLLPSDFEMQTNRRSRSAKLRVFEKYETS
jgi:16S rRNA (cytosine1402-N4)-methyltransferase